MGTGTKALKPYRNFPKEYLRRPHNEDIALTAFHHNEIDRSLRKRYVNPTSHLGKTMWRDRFDQWMQDSGWYGKVRTDCFGSQDPHPISEIKDWLVDHTHGRFTCYCWNEGQPGDLRSWDHWYVFFWFEQAADAEATKKRWSI